MPKNKIIYDFLLEILIIKWHSYLISPDMGLNRKIYLKNHRRAGGAGGGEVGEG